MRRIYAVALVALCLSGMAMGSAAQDVTLISRDGRVQIDGTLVGYDGEFYRVDTIYGELTVDGSGVACSGPGCPNLEDFVAELSVSGAAIMGQVLLPALIQGFALREGLLMAETPLDESHDLFTLTDATTGRTVARISLRATSTDEGFADLLADETDIVMALREVRDAEVALARDAGLGDLRGRGRVRVVALDALVPIVAPDNPIDRIATPELAQVLAGQIVTWAQLGGVDAPITLHLREAESGLAQAVVDRLVRPIDGTLVPGVHRHATDAALADAVARDPFGIGVTSVAASGPAKPLALTGNCGFALSATRKAVKTEDYPLAAPLFLYLPAQRLPKIGRDFLSYLRSAPAQLVVRRAGLTDQAPEEIPIDDQGDRFANAIAQAGPEVSLTELQRMVQRLMPLKRITTTFRFEVGSARLDAPSRSNVEQLARALEAGQYDTRALVFVGFSDGDGPAAANQAIALRRAEAVRDAVRRAAETANFERVALEVDAFGEAMPMACDDSAWGRQVNRRVEVWLR